MPGDPMRGEGVERSTADLLAASAAGEQAAWDLLVQRYGGLVWSVARAYRLRVGETDDAVQNTWLRLVEHLTRISDPEHLGGWLATTARRECLQLLRRRGRTGYTTDLLDDLEVEDARPELDAALLAGERDAALWAAVSTLPGRCWALLRTLMASPPPSYAEVAAALDMPVGSIGPTRQRCLEQLRRRVEGDSLLDPRAATDPRDREDGDPRAR
ncbi:RNA polymerase sigma factor [Phycicoccus sp. HDW14]|uniref:RNA polymerase sigma factor n=1 Tax=Phycicoccus sp. HDW14 TaxID=2714941 RepID=UPI001F0FFA80|nr:sigma-70 family RNA polymerase sigma factor [Phycicoccus sp. HDW14]